MSPFSDKWFNSKHGSQRYIYCRQWYSGQLRRNAGSGQHHRRSIILSLSLPRDSHPLRTPWSIWFGAQCRRLHLPRRGQSENFSNLSPTLLIINTVPIWTANPITVQITEYVSNPIPFTNLSRIISQIAINCNKLL